MTIPGIHTIHVPLPNNPLKSLNSYLILPNASEPQSRGLLIDTGFDHPQAREAILEALHSLDLPLERIDLLATHLHSDHSGQLAYLQTPSSRCFAGRIDGPLINAMTQESYWQRFQNLYTIIGLDVDGITYKDHPGYQYCPKTPIDFQLLKEDDCLVYGDFTLRVIEVPGHTPGQIVLFDDQKRLLISADHILDQITPNISFWGFEHGDALGTYLTSLDKISALNAQVALPSHRNTITEVNARIDALKLHHEERLDEVLQILKKSPVPMTPRHVAAQMHWTVRQNHFDAFPSPQKWFASAEAMAHLVHLTHRGLADMQMIDGVSYFNLTL